MFGRNITIKEVMNFAKSIGAIEYSMDLTEDGWYVSIFNNRNAADRFVKFLSYYGFISHEYSELDYLVVMFKKREIEEELRSLEHPLDRKSKKPYIRTGGQEDMWKHVYNMPEKI